MPDARRRDKLEQRGSSWYVLSETGRELDGPFDSREAAAERLRQIEAAKAARADRADRGAAVSRRVAIRFDAAKAVRLDNGMLDVPGVATRVGIFDYEGSDGGVVREFRSAAEVMDPASLRTLDGVPLTIDHPDDEVTAGNARDLTHGWVLRVWPDGDLVRVTIRVASEEAQEAIRAGKRELSCGYTAIVTAETGTHGSEGEYNAVQSGIRYNHLALVDAARAGPVARVTLDGKRQTMKIRHDGQTYTATATAGPVILAGLRVASEEARGDMIETGTLTIGEGGEETELTLPMSTIKGVLEMLGASPEEASVETESADERKDQTPVGMRIAELMAEAGIDVAAGAAATGIDAATIEAVLAGEAMPTEEQARMLAEALGADPAELIGLIEADAAGGEMEDADNMERNDHKTRREDDDRIRRIVNDELRRADARRNATAALVAKARPILGESFRYDSSDAAIMGAVVEAVEGVELDADTAKRAARGDAHALGRLGGLFDVAVDLHAKHSDRSGETVAALVGAPGSRSDAADDRAPWETHRDQRFKAKKAANADK